MLAVYVMLGIYYFNLKNCYIIMNLRTFWRLFLVIVVSLGSVHSQKISCRNGSFKGTLDVTGETNQLDSGTGNTILLSGQDFEYKFECCGLVTGWEYYGKTNTGHVYFQVWRDVANTPSTLAGENRHTHTGADGAYNVTVNANDRIQVKDGDYMGMHFPGNTFVPYNNGHKIQISYGGYTTSSLTFDWTAVKSTNNRDYAVKAYIEPYADLVIMTPNKSLDNTQDIQLRCNFGENYNHIEVHPWTQRIGSTTVRKLNGSNTVKQSVLDIPYSSYQDVGTYTCSVYNHCGIKKTSIEVTVKDKPVITETIKMERQNQNEVITVDFYSIPKPLKVEWLKEDSILSLSEKYRQSTSNVQISLTVHNVKVKTKGYRAQLIITKVTEKDYGIYKLQIENNKGIAIQLVDFQRKACRNGSFKGTPDVTGKTNQLDGGTGNTILLIGQDYKFECCGLVTGWEYYGKTNKGDVYFQVWRDVGNTPSTLAGENRHTHTGADGSYNVTVYANDRIQVKDGDYMGMHFPGNTFIPYHNGHQIQISKGDYTTSSLIFNWTAVTTTNNSDYAVKAYLERYADLIIMTPNKSLDNTQDIQLICNFGDNYNHIEVYPWTQRIGSTTVRKLNGSNTVKRSVLDIPYSSYQDVGTYTCSVYNHCGIKKTSIEVTVKDKPVITETIKMERQNQNEVITVDFYSIPKPLKVEWLKEDSILSLSEKYRQSTSNVQISLTVHGVKVKMKGYRAQLIITNVTEKDYGIYKLRIENNKGIAIQLVEFQQKAEKKEFNFIGVGIGVSIGIGVSFLIAAVVVTIIVIVHCRGKNPGRREEVESDRTDELTYQELQISRESYVYNEPGTQGIRQSNINSNVDSQSGDREHSYLEPVTRPF